VKNMTGSETENIDAMTTLMREIIKALVDDTSAASVSAAKVEDVVTFQVRVAPNDVGKIIGKQGRTARSLRTILSAASMKLHQRFTLEVLE
jgi:predicted RNA-binding protein YlqC (UPF0109 family)